MPLYSPSFYYLKKISQKQEPEIFSGLNSILRDNPKVMEAFPK